MNTIKFNETSKTFSVIEDQKSYADLSKITEHLGKHQGAYIRGGASALGALSGGLIARKKAKASAEQMGLKPGTPEYKKYMAKKIALGTGLGAGAGLAVGDVGARGTKAIQNVAKTEGKLKDKIDVALKNVKESYGKDIKTVKDTANKGMASVKDSITKAAERAKTGVNNIFKKEAKAEEPKA